MKLSDEYLNKSLLELGAWSWNREPSKIELNSDRLTIELETLPIYSVRYIPRSQSRKGFTIHPTNSCRHIKR